MKAPADSNALASIFMDRWEKDRYGKQQRSSAPVVISVDQILLNRLVGDVELFIGIRHQGDYWKQDGRPLLSVGGHMDPSDVSVMAAGNREKREEAPGGVFEIDPQNLPLVGPAKLGYKWVPGTGPMLTGELCQDIPVVTPTYLAWLVEGEPGVSDEMPEASWRKLSELILEERVWAFSHALVLQYLIDRLRERKLIDF